MLDLLKKHENVLLEDIKKWNTVLIEWGEDTDVKSLRWSQELLLKFCKLELKDAVNETFNKLETKHHGG